MTYDVVVIGGGPSGLMAAHTAAKNGANTLIIEKGSKLGRKLAISGGGRCNVTNVLPDKELIDHIPGNGRFLYSAFSIFDNQAIIDFFENLGVALKEEDKGRMFPVSDSAQTVVQTLLRELDRHHVEKRLNTRVEAIHYGNEVHEIILPGKEKVATKSVVIAVGGKSVPKTGSEGDGYAWAKTAGHTITELYPTEVPMTSKEPFIRNRTLQGISLRDVAITALKPNGKPIKTHRWDLLFTHQGISGPAALRLSQFVVKALKKFEVDELVVEIDSFPDEHENQLVDRLTKMAKESPNKAVKSVWKPLLPERFLLFIFRTHRLESGYDLSPSGEEKSYGVSAGTQAFSDKSERNTFHRKSIHHWWRRLIKRNCSESNGFQIYGRALFCGEILDIHGYTGGFNITAAFSTGYVAGLNAAERALGR